MKNFYSVTEVMQQYASNIEKKAGLSFISLLGKAILAGAMIAFGAEASNVSAHFISNVGIARTVAGAVFPIGLMMVILLGAELFTGDCMLAIGVPEGIISFKKFSGMLLTIYLGNFIGGGFIAGMTCLSGQYNYSDGGLGAYTIKVALSKVNLSFGAAVVSGILCNILVCAAVLMAMCATDITGKLLASFFIIFAFVISGFEHCVANMYYITAGLFCKLNPYYVEAAGVRYGITPSSLDSLCIKNFLLSNLVPVTIGNIIGGALCVGIPLYYLNVGRKVNTIKKQEEPKYDDLFVNVNPGLSR